MRKKRNYIFVLHILVILFLGGVLSASAATLTVTKTADTNDGTCDADCSLREAIAAAAAAGDTIQFSALFDMPQIVALPGGQLTFNKSLTIAGPGANLLTVQNTAVLSPTSRVFNITGGTVAISGMTVRGGNVNGEGGGLRNAGNLTITACIISNNSASAFGGGIRNSGTLIVNDSAILNNSTTAGTNSAGGIDNGGTLEMTNSTVSGNSSTVSPGTGGIWSLTSATITNSTVTNNNGVGGTGGLYRQGGTFTVRNSIVAGNQNNSSVPDVLGVFVSSGYNLIGNRGSVTNFNQAGDQTGTGASPLDPLLYPLGNYGGGTPTHALRSGSPAVNPAGSNGAPADDQRGAPRPFGATADIGAFEFLPMVTNASGSGAGSLRQTVADVPANGFVVFEPDFFAATARTIPVGATGQIQLSKNLEIVGPGANLLTVSGGGASRLFNIGAGNSVAISGLTISDGRAASSGGAINNQGTLSLTNCVVNNNTSDLEGGALDSTGAVSIVNSTFSNNTATTGDGGGIAGYGVLNIFGTTFFNNRAPAGNGGGIAVMNGGALDGSLNAVNSTFSGNTASATGGGVSFDTSMGSTMTSCTVTLNRQTNFGSSGGGLGVAAGAVTLRNTIIANNTKGDNGQSDIVTTGGTVSASSSYNLIGTGGGGNLVNGVNSNQVGIADARLGSLAGNGGSTPTHHLMPGSPAIDKGHSFGLATDQRGQIRVFDAPSIPNLTLLAGDGTDIGAYEIQIVTAAAVSVAGRVLTADGRGLQNALVYLTDQSGATRAVRTGSFGYYRFEQVAVGETYVLAVQSKRERFSPQVVYITEELTDLNFTAWAQTISQPLRPR